MSRFQLDLAGRTLTLTSPHTENVALDRLTWTMNAGQRLLFTAWDLDLVGCVGLFSSVRLWSNDRLIFTGMVIGERSFSSPQGRGKRLEAGGPMDLARSIIACDEAGIPKLSYADTTVGAVLADLLGRHGDQLRQVAAAGSGDFYDASALADLTDPVDQCWLENRDLGSAMTEALDFAPLALSIDLDALFWHVIRFEQLPEFTLDLSSSSAWALGGYVIDRQLENSYSAVKLVSDRQVVIDDAEAAPAWDTELEAQWSLGHAHYDAPDGVEPDASAWVYRRFSYAGVSGLLEGEPVELVQKVKDVEGNVTYVPIEALPVDRENKYVIARHPVLGCAGAGRINVRNALIPGKAQAGDVRIRYRRFGDEPRLVQRYPAEEHSGWALDSGGLARDLVVYFANDRQITAEHAHRIWRQVNRADQRIALTLTGPLPEELLVATKRLRLRGCRDLELLEASPLLPERLEYDFANHRWEMNLWRLR